MCNDIAGTTFVLLYEGNFGMIGLIVVDYTFGYENFILPIDTIIVDLTRVELDDSKFGPEENV